MISLYTQLPIDARQLEFCVGDVMVTRDPVPPYTARLNATAGTKRAVTPTLLDGVKVQTGSKRNAEQAPPHADSVELAFPVAVSVIDPPPLTVFAQVPVVTCPENAQFSDTSAVETVPAPVEFAPGLTVTMLASGPKASPTPAFPVRVNAQGSDDPEQSEPE